MRKHDQLAECRPTAAAKAGADRFHFASTEFY
jgi:hypothetical protein